MPLPFSVRLIWDLMIDALFCHICRREFARTLHHHFLFVVMNRPPQSIMRSELLQREANSIVHMQQIQCIRTWFIHPCHVATLASSRESCLCWCSLSAWNVGEMTLFSFLEFLCFQVETTTKATHAKDQNSGNRIVSLLHLSRGLNWKALQTNSLSTMWTTRIIILCAHKFHFREPTHQNVNQKANSIVKTTKLLPRQHNMTPTTTEKKNITTTICGGGR